MVRARDPGGRSFLTAVLEPSTQVVADMKYSGDQEWSPSHGARSLPEPTSTQKLEPPKTIQFRDLATAMASNIS
jgi:hypothetical protein